MVKVTLVGAGSSTFARQVITDILAIDGLDGGEFGLVDVDERRLGLTRDVANRLLEITGKQWSVTASPDRTEILPGSDFIVNSVEVGGLANALPEYEIPMKYGVDQCIGDTIGPGG